jgi:hypothetical protein
MLRLADTDNVVAAWAESAAGPGWSNQPIWVLVKSRLDGALRIECLQPHEQTHELMTLYRVSEAAHRALTRAAEAAIQSPAELAE